MSRILLMCGTPRSGTSYLATVIGSHSRVVMGIERYKLRWVSGDVEPELFARERFFDLRAEDTVLPSRVVFPALGEMEAKFDTCEFVGDKYPHIVNKLNIVQARLPGSCVIFTLREPIAVAKSWDARAADPADRWPKANGFEAGIAFWKQSLCNIVAAKAVGCQVVVLDFDRLVSGTDNEASRHLASVFGQIGASASEAPFSLLSRTRKKGGGGDQERNDADARLLAHLVRDRSWQAFMSAFGPEGFTEPEWTQAS